MGNVAPKPPPRPFDSKSSKTLLHLCLLRDWQRVLIRLDLFPNEVLESFSIPWGSTGTSLLVVRPLHIICAMQPPPQVVRKVLDLSVHAAAVPVQRKAGLSLRWKEWRKRRQGAFPVIVEEIDPATLTLLDRPLSTKKNVLYYTLPEDESTVSGFFGFGICEETLSSSDASSEAESPGVILQLSPSGGLVPWPIPDCSSETSCFCVTWDLAPLYETVARHGTLMPLHVACLYQASAAVVQCLVDAYPAAALASVIGMLPLHWVAAGWTLPPPLEWKDVSTAATGPLEVLRVLQSVVPDAARIQSGNHGMTVLDYLDECMEDGPYKHACRRAVLDEELSASIIFCDSLESFRPARTLQSSLSTWIANKEWDRVLSKIEDDPDCAKQWLYGLDHDDPDDSASPSLKGKRLPLHLACAYGAPVGLITVLLQAYPDAAACPDPHDGSLPLHIACRSGGTLPVVRALLKACADATHAVDQDGRVALHVAALSKAPYTVMEALLEDNFESARLVDRFGKTAVEYTSPDSMAADLLTMVVLLLDAKSI